MDSNNIFFKVIVGVLLLNGKVMASLMVEI